MDIIFLLVPISLVLLGLIVWILLWAVKDGQFEDLEGPAHRILMDQDRIKKKSNVHPTDSVEEDV